MELYMGTKHLSVTLRYLYHLLPFYPVFQDVYAVLIDTMTSVVHMWHLKWQFRIYMAISYLHMICLTMSAAGVDCEAPVSSLLSKGIFLVYGEAHITILLSSSNLPIGLRTKHQTYMSMSLRLLLCPWVWYASWEHPGHVLDLGWTSRTLFGGDRTCMV